MRLSDVKTEGKIGNFQVKLIVIILNKLVLKMYQAMNKKKV